MDLVADLHRVQARSAEVCFGYFS